MKNCIGKDLSKIPLPVNFSEPLSMLQRLVEDYEYRYDLPLVSMPVNYVRYFVFEGVGLRVTFKILRQGCDCKIESLKKILI